MKKAIQRLAVMMFLLAAFQALAVLIASADNISMEVKAQRYGVVITVYRSPIGCPHYTCRPPGDVVLSRQPSGAYFPHTIHVKDFVNGKVQVSDYDISLNGTYTYSECDENGCPAGTSVTIRPLIFNPLNVHADTSVAKPSAAYLTWTNKGDAVLPIRIDRHGPHDSCGWGCAPEKSWRLEAGTAHYEDTGLEAGQRYFYQVCAITSLKPAEMGVHYELCTDSNHFEAYPPRPATPLNVAAKFGSFGQSGVCVGCKKTATTPNVSVTWDKPDKFTEWFEVERFDSGSWTLASLRQNPALTTFLDRAYETRIQGWSWRVCAGNITGRTCSAPVTLGNLIKTAPIHVPH